MTFGPRRNGPFGTIAEYEDPHDLITAAQKVQDAGYTRMDAFTPFPVHGLPEAIGFDESKVPWTVGIAGLIGAVSGMGLCAWASIIAYPHNIGGRPLFSWPQFIPETFELTILFSAFGAVFGMILYNKLPQPHHPVFSAPNFDRASQDRFFLLVEARDPAYDKDAVEQVLKSTEPLNVTFLKEDEEGDW